MWFVREANSGCDGDVILDRAEAGDMAVRMDLDAVPDGAPGIDDRVVADPAIVAHPGVLAYHDIDAGLEPVADADAVVHGGPATDDASSPDLEPAAGPSRPGLATQLDIVLDQSARTDAHGGRKRSTALLRRRQALRVRGFDVSASHRTEPSAAK